MICTECGHLNSESQDICRKCGHPLARFKSSPRLNSRFLKMQGAVQNLTKGQITTGEFEKFLTETEDFFYEKHQEIKDMEIPLDMTGELKQELETGLLGIETFISSIDLLKQYLVARRGSLLEEGIRMAQRANDLVNRALEMNWQSYEIYRESTEELIRYSQPDY